MYASVTSAQVQPGKIDELLQHWRDSLAPAVKGLKGVQAAYVLTDRETGKGMTLVLYDTTLIWSTPTKLSSICVLPGVHYSDRAGLSKRHQV